MGDPVAAFVQWISVLEGSAFENAVCDHLRSAFVDVTHVPAQPEGDGGVDILTHGFTRGYCCYGPEASILKAKKGRLELSIVNKFREDLRRIFEVETDGKSNLVVTPNDTLTRVLGGKKLEVIHLVVSAYDSNKILGPIREEFEKCKKLSPKSHVEPTVDMDIMGPRDLAGLASIGEATLIRLTLRPFSRALTEKLSSTPPIPAEAHPAFQEKMKRLREAGGNPTAVDNLERRSLAAWAKALVLSNELEAQVPDVHDEYEQLRRSAVRGVELRDFEKLEPPARVLATLQHIASEFEGKTRLSSALSEHKELIADGETGRLIGECPLRW